MDSNKLRKNGRKAAFCVCDYCGSTFLKALSEINRKKSSKNFCSRSCSCKYNSNKTKPKTERVTLECTNCGKSFKRLPSKLKRSKHGVYFCSRKCKDMGQRIENGLEIIHPSHYGTISKDYRAMFKREFGIEKCSRCGYDEYPEILEIHHIDQDRSNNNLDNLKVLCPNCHKLVHRGL